MFFDDSRAAFAGLAAATRPDGRLAFLCWQDDTQNELFAIPLRAFGAHTRLPLPSAGDSLIGPRQITELLSGSGWGDIRIGSVNEPAWVGSDVILRDSTQPHGSMLQYAAGDWGSFVRRVKSGQLDGLGP